MASSPRRALRTRQLLTLSPTAGTASTLDGRIIQSFDSFALYDNGRVLAQLRFRGLSVPNQTRVGPHMVTALPNLTRAAGEKLLAGLSISGGANIVAEWQNQGWAIALNNDTMMPNANSIAALDVNVRGDLLFQFANFVNSMAVRRGDKFYQVHNFVRPTPQGDYLIRINSMDLRDDGTVYFLAVTDEDEVVLYEARPLY